jgi:4-amino-4-deoxy-L-arabinose transferase-like glycosyltransferase
VTGLGLVLYLPGLGREILRHPLEAKYALAAREMLEGDRWLVGHLFGELYPDKPPLPFWLAAAAARLGGGMDETTARLPAAAAGVATLLVTLALGQSLFGPAAGLASALALSTSGLYFWYARQGHPDMLLTLWVTLAGLLLWRSLGAAGGRRRAWAAAAFASMGLGVLSKGLLGLLLPLLALVPYLCATGPLAAVPGRLGLWPGLPVFLAVVLAWYVPAVAQNGIAYLRETLVHQHVVRYAQAWVHHGPWYYYVPELLTGLLPWSLFLPGAIVLGWRARAAGGPAGEATPARPFLLPLGWLAAGFVFFSLSTSKRGAYLLPLYPAAALMVGWLWARVMAGGLRSAWLGVPVWTLAGGAALAALGLAVVPPDLLPGHMADTLVPAAAGGRLAAGLLLLGGAALVTWAWRRHRPAVAFGILLAAQAGALHLVAAVRAPQYEARYPARALAARIEALTPPDGPVLSLLGDYDFLVAFYTRRRLVPLPGPSELLAARAAETRHALVHDREDAVLRAPGVHPLAEARLGPKRIVLVRLDPVAR